MLKVSDHSKSVRIRELNDRLRTTFVGGVILVTAAFEVLPLQTKSLALRTLRSFTKFDDRNDPYHEHDLAFFDAGGERFFFKIDYYAQDLRHGSDDPADPDKTRRVLTIGLASDY